MVSLITNPETSGSSGVAPGRPCGTAFPYPSPPMKICKTKPTEAGMSFRINKRLRKRAKNEPK